MWMTVKECLEQVAHFDDTHELATKLREMADAAEPADAYFLREAAMNMEGMADLMRSMAGRLQQTASTPNAALPTAPSAVAQPATVAADPGPLLDLPRVLERIGVGRSKWLALIKDGKAPQPVKVGRRTLWPESEIATWLADSVARRGPAKD